MFRCLDQCDPSGFIAIPIVQFIRRLKFRRFANARINVVVGPKKRRFGCPSYVELVQAGANASIKLPQTRSTDPAAIIFTSGSTGPPKGVAYEHGMFDGQVDLIRDRFGIQPGEVEPAWISVVRAVQRCNAGDDDHSGYGSDTTSQCESGPDTGSH